MKRYKLIKELPTFKVGDIFRLEDSVSLWWRGKDNNCSEMKNVCAFMNSTLYKFPNILTEWFEEIPEGPKTVDDLKYGDKYYRVNIRGQIIPCVWTDSQVDLECRTMGTAFCTIEDAKKFVARRKAKVILERDTKGFKPKFGKNKCIDDFGWEVEFDVESQELGSLPYKHQDGKIRFATEEDAEASIKAHGKEWKIYFGVEE